MQWPSNSDMVGYGNETRQLDMGSFVPLPENMSYNADIWPDMHFDESSNNAAK